MAAGKGTRMNSDLPKVLRRICGKEMVNLAADTARAAGLWPTYVVLPSNSSVGAVLADDVRTVEQREQLGSAHALQQAQDAVADSEHVAVISADVPLVRSETLAALVGKHIESEATVTLLTATVDDPGDLGRVVRNGSGRPSAVIEFADADEEIRASHEVNAGVYCFRTSWLRENLSLVRPSAGGELYLTDLVSLASREAESVAVMEAPSEEALGVNDRVHLAQANAAMRERIREKWMLAGVTMDDPSTVYVDVDVEIGRDTRILPNTHLEGKTRVGTGCSIGPNSTVSDSDISDDCVVDSSIVTNSTLERGVHVGPYSHIRGGAVIGEDAYLGSNVEVKNSRLGARTRSHHFSYIGDAEIGEDVNIGAGAVTCNYDGQTKHRTVIEDRVFIGSGTMLVAPITIGAGASTAAGSVVTRDVPPESLAKGVPARSEPLQRDGGRDS